MKLIKSIQLVLLSVPLLLVMSCGKDKTSDTQSPELLGPPAITDMSEILNASDRKSLNGRAVQFSRVTVQAVVGNIIFWSGSATATDQLPIARGDRLKGEKVTHVHVGSQVDIVGTVRTFESLSTGDLYMGMWDPTITNEERTRIEQSQVFIAADKVTVLP